MSKTVENEEYLDSREAMKLLEASRQRFYTNAKPYLRTYYFDVKKAPWYRKRDILDLKDGKLPRMASISISGIQRDWSTFLRSLGYGVGTSETGIDITTLPQDAVETFKLDASQQFVKRGRITFADNIPICTWNTYYPLELVGEDLLHEMKHGDIELDVVSRIKEKHGIIIGIAKDKLTPRTATFEEQQMLHLHSNDPVLILQRVSYTRDKKTLVLYSDMVLLGSWFAPEYEYEVNIWDK